MPKITVFFSNNKALVWAGLILTASLLSAVFLFPKVFSKKDFKASQNPTQTQNPLLQDSDNDGLQNWEEELYKTDSLNSDSDGDGVSDGEEIKLGRNPAVAGPDDKLTGPSLEETPKNTNLTQVIFEEFMRNGGAATIMQEGGADPEVTAKSVAKSVETFLDKGYLPAQKLVIGQATDLKVNPNATEKEAGEYFKSLGEIFPKYEKNFPEEDDLDLFLEISKSGQTERLKELTPYRESAEKIAAELRNLTVPKDLEDFHAQEIWFLEETAKQLKILENAETDPAAALAIIPARIDLKIEIARFHADLGLPMDDNL